MTPTTPRARTGGPTGVARPYSREEIIVSKTDLKGIITYANDIFVRVSGFSEAELIGRPHNVIRHPDMPRAVFSLLWQTIEEGKELFAYVLNLAADGGHYWVFAHITPSVNSQGEVIGYHSNRRWVEPEICAEVAALYAVVRAAEQREAHTPAAIAAGMSMLAARLAAAGSTYDEFVWSLAGRSAAVAR